MSEQTPEAAKPEGGEQKPIEQIEQPKTKEQIRAEAIEAVLGQPEEKPAEKPSEESEQKPEDEQAKPEEKPEEPGEKPAEKPEEKPEDEQLEKSWSAIVRRDRELQAERKAIRDTQKELEELRQLRQEIEDDPIGFAYKRIGPDGLTRLTARVTTGGRPSPEEETEILRKKTAKQEQTLKEKEESERSQSVQNRVAAYHADLKLAAKPEAFPLVTLRNAIDDALDVAILHAQETEGREVLSPDQALRIMEDHLAEEIKRDHKAGNLTQRELQDPTVKKILGLEEKPESKPAAKPKTPGKDKGHPPPVKAPEQMTKDEWRSHCLREQGLI